MSDTAEFKRSCRNDYIEMAAKRGLAFLQEDADACEEASSYLLTMAKEDPAYVKMAQRAQQRAAEARRVLTMTSVMVRAAAKDIRSSRRQQKGRQS